MEEIILADIYDIYPINNVFKSKRISDWINIDYILNDSLFLSSVIYTSVYNYIYSTYPTKKDFCDIYNDNNNISFIDCDYKTLSNYFFISKDFEKHLKTIKSMLNSKIFLINTIINKLKFRYNVIDLELNDTLFNSIMNIYESYQTIQDDIYKFNTNIFSKNIFIDNIINEIDLEYLSQYEIIQTYLYKDYEYLLFLSKNTTIYYDIDNGNGDIVLNNWDCINNAEKYEIIIDCFSQVTDTDFIILNNYKNIYYLLPKISKYHITISEFMSPTIEPKSDNSFCMFINNINNLNFKIKYTKYLTLNLDTKGNDIYLFPFTMETEIIKEFWKGYLNDKTSLFYDYMLRYYNKIDKSVCFKQDSDNVIILIDNRENFMSIISLYVSLSNLCNKSWTCNVYTSKKSYDFYKKFIGNIVNIFILDEFNKKFNINIYNNILMDKNFWKKLEHYNRCLIIQDDGVLIKKGIESFLKYDYIGAPWLDVNENANIKKFNEKLIGNGGFSLRNPKIMIEIIKTFSLQRNELFLNNLIKIPEDVYFSKYINKINFTTLPSIKIASDFSSEQILNKNSIGFHKIWNYHSNSEIKKYFNK